MQLIFYMFLYVLYDFLSCNLTEFFVSIVFYQI